MIGYIDCYILFHTLNSFYSFIRHFPNPNITSIQHSKVNCDTRARSITVAKLPERAFEIYELASRGTRGLIVHSKYERKLILTSLARANYVKSEDIKIIGRNFFSSYIKLYIRRPALVCTGLTGLEKFLYHN